MPFLVPERMGSQKLQFFLGLPCKNLPKVTSKQQGQKKSYLTTKGNKSQTPQARWKPRREAPTRVPTLPILEAWTKPVTKKSVHGLSSLILASSWISPHQKSEAPADQKASSQLPSDPVTLEVHTGQTWQAVQPEKRKMGPDWKFKENLGVFWVLGFFC